MVEVPSFGLSGKVALVTGGANGIGVGISTLMAEAGATVVIADRNEEAARTIATPAARYITNQVIAVDAGFSVT